MNKLDDLEKRVSDLEARIEGCECADERPSPIPPVEPPIPGEYFNYEFDLSRSYHIDFFIAEGETVVVRFRFNPVEGANSYTKFRAVLMGSGPCIKMSIPEYGYEQPNCQEESSESVATDDRFTQWVVPKKEYIYLHITNETNAACTVRLSQNGENLY